jgi:hypothetical protein
MKKLISILSAIALISTIAEAQVKYKLTRLPDNLTYQVSLVSEATWSFPQNVTTTAQVTLRLPSNAHFIAGRIKSLVPETNWSDNVYLESPKGDKNNTYVSFNLQSMGTKAFTFEAGKELPLFTFQNIGTSCFGSLELVDNNSDITKAVVKGGYNVEQHISTLGANGEAFSGLIENKVACQGTTTVQDLENSPLSITKAFPIPASSELNVEWQVADPSVDNVQLQVQNILGENIVTIPLKNTKTMQTTKIDVRNWAEGVFSFRLVSGNRVSKAKNFAVVH